MTKLLSLEEFVQNLCDSDLFSPEEISKMLDALPEPLAADGDALAERLIAAGKLTSFQTERVRERRFDELTIANYQVLDRLGEGGMGTVYKARHRRMNRLVAIKVLSRSVAQSEKFIKRFQREVEAVARLHHPNIVMAHDADVAEVGHFLVMEFVNGRDLAREVQQRGTLPIPEAVEYTLQAARALEYAHGQGIIHRDIKPANLLLDVSGAIKVADLGLARFEETLGGPLEKSSALTQAGAVMGTVDFMSPEQALGLANIDHRADIYSLGCTLYFLLRGEPVYPGPSMMGILLKHREAPIPSLAPPYGYVPVELDVLFRRMVAKAPADRYQTMTEVQRALESVQEILGKKSPTPLGGADFDIGPSPRSVPSSIGNNDKTTFGAPAGEMSPTIHAGSAIPQQGPPLKVLLVEPSRTQSAIIRKYLQAQGVQQVIAVALGQEALQAVMGARPDVIVSSFHLADMTGVQLAEQVWAESQAAAPGFVLISSEAERSQAGTLSKCGQAVVLQKPFTPEHLGQALKVVASVPATPAATPARSQLRVLIVDDSATARRHVRGVLQQLGVTQFTEAVDGAQAVAAAAQATFDLIVTDYNMPFMGGHALVGYLKQNPATAAIPIIMVTTEEDPGKLEAVRQLDVASICPKSFPPEMVEKILHRLGSRA